MTRAELRRVVDLAELAGSVVAMEVHERPTNVVGHELEHLPLVVDDLLPRAFHLLEPCAYVLTVYQANYGPGQAGNC